jgi:hypothetical protein
VTRQWDESQTEAGYRLHLHRASDERPVELDPDGFEFAEPAAQAPLVQLTRWLSSLAPDALVDDGFKWHTPALGAAAAAVSGAAGSLDAMSDAARRQRKGASVRLDNLAQFRFYSAWRGMLERRPPPG